MIKLALILGLAFVSVIISLLSECSPSRMAEKKYSKECARRTEFTLDGLPDGIFKYRNVSEYLNQFHVKTSRYPDSIEELDNIEDGAVSKAIKEWKIEYHRSDSIGGYRLNAYRKEQVDSLLSELKRRLSKSKEFDRCRDSLKLALEKKRSRD